MNLLDSFQRYIDENDLATHDDRILLTVSGGVDSMVMLSLFTRCGYRVGVAHCNFQLRGAESDEDEVLVEDEAKKYGAAFYNRRFETKAEMERTGESMEMAARRLRYAWFDALSREHGYTAIAIAHHADDSIETFFINLLRGTGLRGLTGISTQVGKVIRPLLFASRKEILEYAVQNRIPFREDSSNRSTKYLRNKIRLGLIPRIREINPKFTDLMRRNIERLTDTQLFIDALTDQLAATILDEAARAFNQITVYGRDSEAGQVINLCRQMPMMGQYQVVILKEAQQLKGLDKLSLYTQKPSPTTILVICHKEKNADKRSAFYKGCAANGTVLESVRPRDYEIAAWLQQFIRQKGFTIDPKALSMLTDHLGTDIAKISNELQKLTVSLPEGTQRITDADIEANIGISKDFNNFELCKAVVTRDMARALMIAEHFARNPKDNPLLVTVMALFGQFKELFVVNYLRWLARHKGKPFPPDTELMRILRKNNTFVIGEIKQNAAGWDNRKVFNILGLLREYDAKSKGLGAGGASDGELLRELLLKIFLL